MPERISSHRQIFKSTSLVGGSKVINVLISAFRIKILAVLLGPPGIALFGLYGAATGLISTLASMGIANSSVRQIAIANSVGDRSKLSRTIITLRRLTLLTGILGAGILLVLCVPVSSLTFGDDTHAGAFALLSLSIFFTSISAGQTALIQGMRRIRELAIIQVVSAFLGVVVTVPLVWFFHEGGVATSMVASSAMVMLVSCYFAHRVRVDRVALAWREFSHETRDMIGLGIAFMFSVLMTAAADYFIRTYIVRQLGIEAAGYYQAAFSLAGVYVGIILGSMAADYYPRLTAAAQDNEMCNRLVNDQAEVGLLIAGPGIIATLVFAPLVIQLFYSADFSPAVEVLKWQVLGLLGRVVSWPMGFVTLAKGRGKVFVISQALNNVVHVLMVVCTVPIWGLEGAGMSFFGLYIYHVIAMRAISGWLSGFSWTTRYLRHLIFYSFAITVVFFAPRIITPTPALIIGCVFVLIVSAYSAKSLYCLLGAEYVRGKVSLWFGLPFNV